MSPTLTLVVQTVFWVGLALVVVADVTIAVNSFRTPRLLARMLAVSSHKDQILIQLRDVMEIMRGHAEHAAKDLAAADKVKEGAAAIAKSVVEDVGKIAAAAAGQQSGEIPADRRPATGGGGES